MGKMLKNLLIVLSLVCAIMLIVFCVQLFMINRESGNDGETLQFSGSPGNDGEDDNDDRRTSSDDERSGDADLTGNKDRPEEQSPPTGAATPPTGRPYEILMPGNLLLILYADENQFEYSEHEDSYRFRYTGEGTATLEIPLLYMQFGLELFVLDYLDGFVGSGGTSVGNEGTIGRSSVDGIFVSGSLDGENYEAWIHSFSDIGLTDMGIAFELHYRSDEQKTALYTILDTLELVTA